MTIARDRWQQHLKTRGALLPRRSREQRRAPCTRHHPTVGADVSALALECLAGVLEACRVGRLTRNQHVLLRLGELIAYAEAAAALVRRAVGRRGRTACPRRPTARFDAAGLAAISRVFAREAALKVAEEGVRWVAGAADPGAAGRCVAGLPLDARPRRPGRAARRHGRASPTSSTTASTHTTRHQGLIMNEHRTSPVAVVGIAAIMPDAPDAAAFWQNIRDGRYCISDVPPERWDPELYYDPDPAAPDKTYSRIGGWVREYPWDPLTWRLPIPPKVAAADGRRPAVGGLGRPLGAARRRLAGLGRRPRAGRGHPRQRHRRREALPDDPADPVPGVRPRPGARPTAFAVAAGARARSDPRRSGTSASSRTSPEITEDTMPGELANVLAGRVANLFNFRGPNFTTDAACASGLAAMSAAVHGLVNGEYDAVITGGIDRNMGVYGFVKFCKIGALSATGTRPFDAGADGFVMGEGAALFVLKRLADAERDGDRIYAVLLGLGGSSDGKGKGITAPNPVGQRLAVERAWAQRRARSRRPPSAIEAHGTSTRVGDAAELASLGEVFGERRCRAGLDRAGLGQVQHRPPEGRRRRGRAVQDGRCSCTRRCSPRACTSATPTRTSTGTRTPFRVNTELREWPADPDGRTPRRRQRVRLRRHQLPRRPRGVRPGPAPRRRALHATFASARGAVAPRVRAASRAAGAGDGAHREGAAARRARARRARRRRPRGASSSAWRPTRPPARRRLRRAAGPGARRRRRPRRHRLRRRRRPRGEGRQGRQGLPLRRPGACGRCCAPRASSSAGAPRPRWRSSTPARARSTSTCSRSCAPQEPRGRRDLRRGRPDHDARCSAGRSRRTSSSTRRTRTPCAALEQQLTADRDHPAGRARPPTWP